MTVRMSGPVPADEIRQLATPELALRLLACLGADDLNANNTLRGAEQAFANESDAAELLGRLSDAWAWLESHGLIGPSARNTASVWQRLTRAGHEAKSPMPP
ncbi:hypothetical protein ACQPW3_25485 [Actinosynnema sp. CA-248983]